MRGLRIRHPKPNGWLPLAAARNAFMFANMRDSKFYKAMVGFDNGGMTHCDAIEYDDTLWLVPKWLDVPAEGYRTPERMLRLDQFQHQMFPAPSPINVAVSEPIPHALYSGELTPALKEKYQLYDHPDFRFKTAA